MTAVITMMKTFVSRGVVVIVYKYKKNLKEMDSTKMIMSISPLKLKLKSVVKDIDGVSKLFTKDGNIYCNKEILTVITSPDDLFNPGPRL